MSFAAVSRLGPIALVAALIAACGLDALRAASPAADVPAKKGESPSSVTPVASSLPPQAVTPPTPAANPRPQLALPEPVFDFGTVPQSQAVQHEFTISNSGSEELTLSDVRPSCGCTTTGEWPHSLKPGASAKIPIRLDTSHFVGPITKTITIVSNDPAQSERTLELKGVVWTPVTIATPVLIFPAAENPDESATRATTIRSETAERLTLKDLSCDNPHFKAELREITPGKEFEVSVATVPPLPEGTHTGRITLKSSNAQVPEITIQAVVTVLPAVQVAPNQFAFTTAKLAAPEKRFAVVLNRRSFDLKVTDVTTNAPGVQLSISSSPDHSQTTITLSFPAGFEIPAEKKLFLRGKTNHPGLPTFEVPIIQLQEG